MVLDKALNLVVPVERPDGTTIYVHSAPIAREVFDQYFLVIAKAFSALYNEGLGIVAGPRIAAKMLTKTATEMGVTQAAAVEGGLVAEMRRLSNVLVPGPQGWAPMPLHEAIGRGVLDADDADEVENAIAFFILASAMHKKKEARPILTEAAKLWSAQITSLNSTAFAASLPMSITDASSGEKVPQSLIPS